MDNRDEEENRTEAITPTDDKDNADWDDADPSDMSKVSTVPQDDLSEANEMDFEESLRTDSETSDEFATPGVSDSTSAPEKDFLIDSGLAAAISPKNAGLELTTEDVLDEDAEESESAWTDSESALAYQVDDIDDKIEKMMIWNTMMRMTLRTTRTSMRTTSRKKTTRMMQTALTNITAALITV